MEPTARASGNLTVAATAVLGVKNLSLHEYLYHPCSCLGAILYGFIFLKDGYLIAI